MMGARQRQRALLSGMLNRLGCVQSKDESRGRTVSGGCADCCFFSKVVRKVERINGSTSEHQQEVI